MKFPTLIAAIFSILVLSLANAQTINPKEPRWKQLSQAYGFVLAFHFSFAWGCRLRESTRKMTAAASRKSVFRLGLEDLMSLLDQSNPDPSQEARRSEFWLWLQSKTFHSIFLVSCARKRKLFLAPGVVILTEISLP